MNFSIYNKHIYLDTARSSGLYQELLEWRNNHDKKLYESGSQFRDNNDLFIKKDHWGDWLFFSRDDDNGGSSAVTSKKIIAQAFYCYSTQLLLKSAKVLGHEEDIKTYTELYQKIYNAFNNEFVTKNGMLISDTQTAYVLALQFNLLSKEHAKVAVERLVDNINDYGHLTTGFLGTPFLCHVLSANGKEEEAIKLLLRTQYPSWLYP